LPRCLKPHMPFRFGCCQLRFIEEVSQSFFVLELWTSIFWGRLAEILPFGPVNFHFLKEISHHRFRSDRQITADRWMDG
jgi:hypothetical protein